MQKTITLRLLPSEAASETLVKQSIARTAGVKPEMVNGYLLQKQSIDSRGRQPWVNLTLLAFIDEPFRERVRKSFSFRDVHKATQTVIIVGAGPAGLFAALQLIESGIRPIILERGKDVRARRRDLALLNKEGAVNPDSNYCFGEGGAGTRDPGRAPAGVHDAGAGGLCGRADQQRAPRRLLRDQG